MQNKLNRGSRGPDLGNPECRESNSPKCSARPLCALVPHFTQARGHGLLAEVHDPQFIADLTKIVGKLAPFGRVLVPA